MREHKTHYGELFGWEFKSPWISAASACCITLPSGARIAVCDDPQGAAFALHA